MQKKWLSLVFSVALLPTAFAQHGFYYGVNGGSDAIEVAVKDATFDVANIGIFGFNLKLADTSAGFGGFIGYQWLTTSHFYFAIEAFAKYSLANPNVLVKIPATEELNIPINATLSAQLDYTFGLAFIQGYKPSDNVLFYWRIAPVTDDTQVKLAAQADPLLGKASESIDEQIGGILGGLGVDYYFNKHLSAGMQYSLTFYPAIKISARLAELEGFKLHFNANVSLLVNEFDLRVAYHF